MARATATPPELPGYDYVRLLGSGGFSDVFLYRQRLPRRDVAVKVLLTDELNSASRNQFVAEANVMAQLSTHPYIVTIYHADVAGDERPYFVMEYCSGPSLADRYKRERFEVADSLRTGIRLAGAIATAHAAGFLHRDIKPANVLTNDFGWPALTDFGISSTIDGDVLSHTTTTGSLARAATETGTSGSASVGMSVPWSPPEMFEDDPSPDARSDIFSLAATIHTLLAGRTPFEFPGRSNGTLDIIGRIERGAITPIDRDDLPRSLVSVLQTAMSPRRSDRYASAIDFARALQRVELELGYSPTTIEVPNLAVVAPDARTVGEEDETRARSVSTIVAQPADATVAPEVDAASTQLRRPVTVVPATSAAAAAPVAEQTILRPSTPVEPVPDEPSAAPRRRVGLIVGIVAAVIVIAAGVTAIIALPRTGNPTPAASSGTGSGGGEISVDVVPTPLAGTATATGSTVTFTWKNPKPKTGDTYQWTAEATNANPVRTTKPLAVLTGVAPGTSACIDVVVVRAGRASATALKECSS
jgi:eukaryotic-like serine/threonine-protein kinase